MVKLMGHVAIGLLFSTPAWYLWHGRTRLAFIGFVLATVMLPDVDLVLQHVIPGVEHHGVTHTILFVVTVSVVVGLLASHVLMPALRRWWFTSEADVASKATIYRFVIGGLLLGGLSHLFADILSAPDIAQPTEPLWPLFDKPIAIDVIYYSSIWWNLGLLVVALLVHLGLAVHIGGLPAGLGRPERR